LFWTVYTILQAFNISSLHLICFYITSFIDDCFHLYPTSSLICYIVLSNAYLLCWLLLSFILRTLIVGIIIHTHIRFHCCIFRWRLKARIELIHNIWLIHRLLILLSCCTHLFNCRDILYFWCLLNRTFKVIKLEIFELVVITCIIFIVNTSLTHFGLSLVLFTFQTHISLSSAYFIIYDRVFLNRVFHVIWNFIFKIRIFVILLWLYLLSCSFIVVI